MATPPDSSELQFDSSRPFRGVVVCCTSIAPELRTHIANQTTELGGVHKYDLTPDVTHLIVGEYDTPKYRHVAKERPDIVPMAAGWVEAVRDLWMADTDIDFTTLEQTWRLRTFETSGGGDDDSGAGEQTADGNKPEAERKRLLLCLTGFEDPAERQSLVELIKAHGGAYTGDLTKRVTHLVVARPEGKKFAAAKTWGLHTVSVEWLHASAERGMILDEKYFDPLWPAEERGKGAWTVRQARRPTLGKRLRDAAATAQEQRKTKLRRTASFKLSSQMGDIWGGIKAKEEEGVGGAADAGVNASTSWDVTQQLQLSVADALPTTASVTEQRPSTSASLAARQDEPVFSSCLFCIHGFPQARHDVLVGAIATLGGTVCASVAEVVSDATEPAPTVRFLIVPQQSLPDSHPHVPDSVQLVTEFYVEKCLHKRQFFDPKIHVIGRPFPRFPIEGFEKLAICTAGFTNVDLNQIDKTIRQLGAKFEERFTNTTSILVCHSLAAVRKQKLELALAWKVPVASADWLWHCVATGHKVPVAGFLFPELRQRLSPPPGVEKDSGAVQVKIEPDPFVQGRPAKKHGVRALDATAFANEAPVSARPAAAGREAVKEEESNATTHFETALTHQSDGAASDNGSARESAPLSERSANSLNRGSLSPQKLMQAEGRGKVSKTGRSHTIGGASTAEVGEDDGDVNKKARLAAERLALSAKLTSLLESAAPAAVAVAVPGNGEGDGDGSTGRAQPSAAHDHNRPRRRGPRSILGRAISNVSAGSSASVESSSGSASAQSRLLDRGGDQVGAASGRGRRSNVAQQQKQQDLQQAQQPPPPPTQLEFSDPEATRQRAELMGKMMRAVRTRSWKGAGDPDDGKGEPREGVTETAAMAEIGDGLEGGDGHSRRTRRRA